MEAGFLDDEVKRFTDICEPLVKASPWVEGSLDFVQALVADHLPLFVVSGTPQKPLETMLRERQAMGYFEGVYGSPPDKITHLRRILSEGEFEPSRVIFIGDAPPDAEAAQRAGLRFVYRPSEAARPRGEPDAIAPDLRALLADFR